MRQSGTMDSVRRWFNKRMTARQKGHGTLTNTYRSNSNQALLAHMMRIDWLTGIAKPARVDGRQRIDTRM